MSLKPFKESIEKNEIIITYVRVLMYFCFRLKLKNYTYRHSSVKTFIIFSKTKLIDGKMAHLFSSNTIILSENRRNKERTSTTIT